MLNFQNPAAFLLLLLIPLLFLLRKLKIFAEITIPAVLSDWNGEKFKWNKKSRKILSFIAKIFLAWGYIISVSALADPVIVKQEKVYTSLGSDIIFVVDTSPSMAAEDINGIRRLDAAKNTITELFTDYDGSRYGIVALGTNASVIVPPTNDLSVVKNKIEELSVGMMGNGSAIGDGISTALCHLTHSSAPKKCIILLTDGENNAGVIHPETAASLSASNNIPIYIVGIGSKGSVPIEYEDPASGKLYSGYLDSNFDSHSLRAITNISKGRYFEVSTIADLKNTLEIVAKTESLVQNFTYRESTQALYKNFLHVAIILILLSWFIRHFILREIISFRVKRIFILRTIFLFISFVMVLLASAGLFWGTYYSPVQKNGSAVSFVFDISNSMLAKDGINGKTRLESSAIYAKKLLSKMQGTSVSVVLAKGDGVVSIPITEDYSMIESLLDVLSPKLMTAPGSSLGKGILKAKSSFPSNFSAAGQIWLFTDCEETDSSLKSALVDSCKAGIPVTVIGFGETKESTVLAGDGITYVNTALRSQSMKNIISEVESKLNFYKHSSPVNYYDAEDKGSAVKLLNQLKNDSLVISYEEKPLPRFKLFLLLALLFFAFSYIFTEFDFSKFSVKKKGLFFSLVMASFLFTSCNSNSQSVVKGLFDFSQKRYRQAIAQYLLALNEAEIKGNQEEIDYILYNLGTTYLALDENLAALEKFSLISENANDTIRYSSLYNSGIVNYKIGEYDKAIDLFKQALKTDSTKEAAKINLELSIRQAEVQVQQSQSQALPSSENDGINKEMENSIFERIKENDKKQWKNSESNQSANLAQDY